MAFLSEAAPGTGDKKQHGKCNDPTARWGGRPQQWEYDKPRELITGPESYHCMMTPP